MAGIDGIDPGAAASYRRMSALYGSPLPVTSGRRTRAEQADLRAKYLAGRGAFALPAGTSVHELGLAVDFGAAAYAWLQRCAAAHGWVRTNLNERWHYEYRAALDEYLHDPAPAPAAATQMEDEMPWFFRRKDGAVAMVSPTGVRRVTLEAWQVWTNLGHTSRYDELDDGPFDVMVQSLGGWAA